TGARTCPDLDESGKSPTDEPFCACRMVPGTISASLPATLRVLDWTFSNLLRQPKSTATIHALRTEHSRAALQRWKADAQVRSHCRASFRMPSCIRTEIEKV